MKQFKELVDLLSKHDYDETLIIEALLHYFDDLNVNDEKMCMFYLEVLKWKQLSL